MRLVSISLALGIVAAISAAMLVPQGWPPLASALLIALAFTILAGVGGYIRQGHARIVGLLVLAPLGLLLLSSVAFAGNLAAFVRHDLVPLAAAAAGALGGAQLGAWLARRAGRAA